MIVTPDFVPAATAIALLFNCNGGDTLQPDCACDCTDLMLSCGDGSVSDTCTCDCHPWTVTMAPPTPIALVTALEFLVEAVLSTPMTVAVTVLLLQELALVRSRTTVAVIALA